MPLIDVKILSPSTAEYDSSHAIYHAPLYDILDGTFWMNACIPKSIYENAIKSIDNKKPYHAFVVGDLKDIIIDQDFLGPVMESRQRLGVSSLQILPSNIIVPEKLITTFTPSIKPYSLAKGAKEGSYVVSMDPTKKAVLEVAKQKQTFEEPDVFEEPAFDDKWINEPTIASMQQMEVAHGGSSSTNPFVFPESHFTKPPKAPISKTMPTQQLQQPQHTQPLATASGAHPVSTSTTTKRKQSVIRERRKPPKLLTKKMFQEQASFHK
ncbi:unnamed protein product [Mucor fragilis]